MEKYLAVLIASHFIADFLLHPDNLIIIGQPLGIGFLVAAKSILRFEESKDRLVSEYVIIGTLLSFTMAIVFPSLAVWAINF